MTLASLIEDLSTSSTAKEVDANRKILDAKIGVVVANALDKDAIRAISFNSAAEMLRVRIKLVGLVAIFVTLVGVAVLRRR